MIKLPSKNTGGSRGGFTFTEVMITMALFMVMASVGVGAYFQYYEFSLVNNDINQINKTLYETRFRAMKNPSQEPYGVHISSSANQLITFRGSYVPGAPENQVVQLEHLDIVELNLLPTPGATDNIVFDYMTGKTQNSGSFTVEKNDYTYTININPQGVFE